MSRGSVFLASRGTGALFFVLAIRRDGYRRHRGISFLICSAATLILVDTAAPIFANLCGAGVQIKPCSLPGKSSVTMKITLPSPIQKVLGILNWNLGPEVLPKSSVLLAVSLVGFAAAVFLFQVGYYSPARAAASGAGSAVLLAAVAMLCARITGYNERLVQTLTALALGGAIVIFIRAFLGFLMLFTYTVQGLPEVNVRQLAAFVLFPLYIWNIFIFAALFRRSFRPSLPVAFALSIGLVLTVYFSVPAVFKSL